MLWEDRIMIRKMFSPPPHSFFLKWTRTFPICANQDPLELQRKTKKQTKYRELSLARGIPQKTFFVIKLSLNPRPD